MIELKELLSITLMVLFCTIYRWNETQNNNNGGPSLCHCCAKSWDIYNGISENMFPSHAQAYSSMGEAH